MFSSRRRGHRRFQVFLKAISSSTVFLPSWSASDRAPEADLARRPETFLGAQSYRLQAVVEEIDFTVRYLIQKLEKAAKVFAG